MLRWLKEQYEAQSAAFVDDALEVFKGADLILYSLLAYMAWHIAESYQIPTLATYIQPVTPTREFSGTSPVIPKGVPFRGVANRLSFKMSNQTLFQMMRGTINDIRQNRLGLPAQSFRDLWGVDTSDIPMIYGYSPAVLPKPSDWDVYKHVTGFWFLDHADDWQPPDQLVDFLAAGPPPVYVGFGSMIDKDSAEVTDIVVQALRRTNQRGILLGGWGGLTDTDLPDDILHIDGAPHDWLFPQMAAVVHHGGAGTTAAGLRAGKPTVTVPFFADQPWWGHIVHRQGLGPAPIARKSLTVERLSAAITQAVTDKAMHDRAEAVCKAINAEDGVAEAVRLIERYGNL